MEQKLNERQKRFVDYYLELGNATRAAELAGYSPQYAAAVKQQPAVKEYLSQRIAQMDHERIASADEVLAYLTGVMRGSDEIKHSPSSMKAAELLGKRFKLFTEELGELPVPVIVDDVGAQPDA